MDCNDVLVLAEVGILKMLSRESSKLNTASSSLEVTFDFCRLFVVMRVRQQSYFNTVGVIDFCITIC
jgi:hypothetical protein